MISPQPRHDRPNYKNALLVAAFAWEAAVCSAACQRRSYRSNGEQEPNQCAQPPDRYEGVDERPRVHLRNELDHDDATSRKTSAEMDSPMMSVLNDTAVSFECGRASVNGRNGSSADTHLQSNLNGGASIDAKHPASTTFGSAAEMKRSTCRS